MLAALVAPGCGGSVGPGKRERAEAAASLQAFQRAVRVGSGATTLGEVPPRQLAAARAICARLTAGAAEDLRGAAPALVGVPATTYDDAAEQVVGDHPLRDCARTVVVLRALGAGLTIAEGVQDAATPRDRLGRAPIASTRPAGAAVRARLAASRKAVVLVRDGGWRIARLDFGDVVTPAPQPDPPARPLGRPPAERRAAAAVPARFVLALRGAGPADYGRAPDSSSARRACDLLAPAAVADLLAIAPAAFGTSRASYDALLVLIGVRDGDRCPAAILSINLLGAEDRAERLVAGPQALKRQRPAPLEVRAGQALASVRGSGLRMPVERVGNRWRIARLPR